MSNEDNNEDEDDATTRQMMAAAVYHAFGGPIRVQAVGIPACPEDGVLIRVQAVGVCRSDWHGWKGHDGDIVHHGLPFVPGHEVSGIVVQSNVPSSFRSGDRVAVPFILSCGHCEFCCHDRQPTVCSNQKQPGFTQYGGFAEFLALPRANGNLVVVPPKVSFVQAAALGCRFTTAHRAVLQQGQLKSTDSIVIFGCGGLGLSCVMLAVAHGCTTIVAVDVSQPALDKAAKLGATHSINVGAMSTSSLREAIKELTRRPRDRDFWDAPEIGNGTKNGQNANIGHGANVTVEASGFASACENAIYCTRPGGRMVQVGLVKDAAVAVPMDYIAAREIQILGSHGFSASDLSELLQMVATGKLDPSVLIEQEVTLQEGAQAIEDMDRVSPLGIVMVTKFPTVWDLQSLSNANSHP